MRGRLRTGSKERRADINVGPLREILRHWFRCLRIILQLCDSIRPVSMNIYRVYIWESSEP